jgi:DNA (cytosine-5)-methyltransferase 1
MKAIDLFAGMGGNTEGARMAGIEVVWAANHWQEAVDAHEMNHPTTAHKCQDLHQADWSIVPSHDLLMASPACTGHTPARGKDRPHHDAARSTAWAVISALEYHRPGAAMIENVPHFAKWELYPAWVSAAHALGYAVSPHIMDAADHGVPQERVRLIIVLTRSKHPLELHFDPKDPVPASSFIHFDAGRWSAVDKPGRAAATLERVANGRRRFGERFVMPYYKTGSGKTGRSLDRPIGTITTRDRWAIVDGNRMRMLLPEESKAAMSFRPSYKLPTDNKLATHMLGNATCPLHISDVVDAIRRAA